MEHKEILAVICAVLAVCILIGVVNMFHEETISEDEMPQITTVSTEYVMTVTTNYWDYLRQQQGETTYAEITGSGSDVAPDATDLTGTLPAVTAPAVTDVTAVSTLPEMSGVSSERTTTSAMQITEMTGGGAATGETVTTTSAVTVQQGYTLVVN